MGPDTTHEEGVVWIPPQGSPQADGAEIAEGSGRRLCFPPAGGCDGGGRFTGVGDLRLPFLEHSPKIYCDWAYYEPMSSGEWEAGSKVVNAMVVTGGF